MKVAVDVKLNVDIDGLTNTVAGDEVGLYTAKEWKRLIDKFTPFKTGNLMNNTTITPWTIIYNAPYATKLYNADGIHGNAMNFNTSLHALAGPQWSERAKPSELNKLVRSVEGEIGRKLNNIR